MSNPFPFVESHQWDYYHDKNNPDHHDANSALAYQDAFIRYVQAINPPTQTKPVGILHIYPILQPTILLGGMDTRLTNLKAGNQYLKDSGYELVQRPHGGLAVVNDPGIINFALVTNTPAMKMSIDEAYQQMVELVRRTLAPFKLTVESYEIPDSYCPGRYDLVVDGKKIGGIAQRRFKDGLAVAAYISVNGNQRQRAEHIRSFYHLGEANDRYPTVNPDTMTTLEVLFNRPISVREYENLLINEINNHTRVQPKLFDQAELKKIYEKTFARNKERSHKIQPHRLN